MKRYPATLCWWSTATALGALLTGSSIATVRASIPDSSTTATVELTADTEELLRISAEVPPVHDAPAQILLDETRLHLTDGGLMTRIDRLVYRVDSEDRTTDWSEVEAEWTPWYQDRPRVMAQVISPGGKVHRLDPTTITEAPVPATLPDVYTDRRILKAPLPAVAAGSVIEEIRAFRDTVVTVDAGVTMRLYLGRMSAVRARRIIVDLPVTLPFQYRVEKFDGLRVERDAVGSRVQVSFTADRVPGFRLEETDPDLEIPLFPALVISTGTNWGRVAAGYRAMVMPQITDDAGRQAVRTLAEATRSAVSDSLSRPALIEQVVRRLHRDIRYTGVELGDAAIRPAFPSESLKRGYGDCKDKSLLMVALLAELGIPAELVVLSLGPGLDLLPGLPGWGLFDHAIVHVPGTPELWIDATDSFSRVGQIPDGVQGRLALPIAQGVTNLVRIPGSPPEENRVLETREIFLQDRGPARVVETTDYTGVPEALFRSQYGRMLPSRLQASMEDHARSAYFAEGKVTAHTTDPQDFSRPFQLVVTVEGAERGITTTSDAAVGIPRWPLFERLPDGLVSFDPDSLDNPAYTGTRKTDLVIRPPVVREWRYRITPPAGFQPDPLPETLRRVFGPMSYRQEFSTDSSGVVSGLLELNPGTGRLTPSEVSAFQKEYAELSRSQLLIVGFHHTGLGLVAEGRLSEGIFRLRREVEDAPQNPMVHIRLSQGLLKAGLGEAARMEARRAVDLAPDDADVLENQGAILSYDLLGRLHRRGCDRRGALDSFRRAVAARPDDVGLKCSLAIQLEFDDSGVRYHTGADLDEAIAIYKSQSDDDLESSGVWGNLPAALLGAGRFKELEDWTRRPHALASVLPYRLAAVAAQRGSDAALAEALSASVTSAERSAALLAAAGYLFNSRRYSAAAALMEAGARGQTNAGAILAQAELFKHMKPYEPDEDSPDDPRSIYRRLISMLFDENSTPGDFLSLVSARWRRDAESGGELLESMKSELRSLQTTARSLQLSPRAMVDLKLGMSEVRVDTGPAGCRLHLMLLGQDESQSMFLKREEGRWVLVDMTGLPTSFSELGAEALEDLGRGDVSAARQWLEWAWEAMPPAPPDSLGPSPLDVFSRGGSTSDIERLKLAAAYLMTKGTVRLSCERALRTLQLAHPEGLTPDEARAIQVIRLRACLHREPPDSLMAAIQSLRLRYPGSRMIFIMEMMAWSLRKDIESARRCAEAQLSRHPDDEDALRVLMNVAGLQEDLPIVVRCGRQLDQAGRLQAMDLNNWAWYELVAAAVNDSTLERINRAILKDDDPSPAALHTQASIYAEMNRTVEARDILLQLMDRRGLDEPDDGAWYVLGRIAEQYGLGDSARDAYHRVEPDTDEYGRTDAVTLLTQRRLALLEGAGTEPRQ